MRIAKRIATLPPYIFAEAGTKMAGLRAKGVEVIDLGMGSPDLPPPRFIIDALFESALKPDNHGYAGYFGIPALRQAVAGYYERRFGVSLDPNKEVLMLIGSKEGIYNICQAFLDAGDVAIVPDPGYPPYAIAATMAGGAVYPVPLSEAHGYLPDLDSIPADVADAAKMLWLNYPNNPTGEVATMEALERAVAFARHHDLLLCYDNPYCDLTFDGYRAPSALEIPGAKDVTIEFNSVSKTYNMPGWRVGMAVGSAQAVQALGLVKTNVDSGIFKPIQEASVAAFNGDQSWLEERNAIYQRRRDVVMEMLPLLGWQARSPKGALYVWAKLPEGVDDGRFCMAAVEQTGVWVTPGSAYGETGAGYVRISITSPEDKLREAFKRLKSVEL